MPVRLGILGGSFDPVHHGHLRLARCARATLRLDRVVLVPTFRQPLKRHRSAPTASAEDRLAMVHRAVRGFEGSLEVSDVEVRRGGTSYTVDTLRELAARQRRPAELFFLAGADSLQTLPRWRAWREVLARAWFCVAARPGWTETIPAGVPPALQRRILTFPMACWRGSSSEVRRRLAAGREVRGLVPPPVEAYIRARGLYRDRREPRRRRPRR